MRFPEFSGEWKREKLKNISSFYSGGTPSINNKKYWNGQIPFISASTMHDFIISSSNQHLTQEGLNHGSKLLKRGNLLLLVRGSMLWNKIPVCYNQVDVAFNQDVKGIILNDKSYTMFLLYWFYAHEKRIKYMVTGTGIGAGKLDTDDLLSLKIAYPDEAEQKKITILLSLLDERIATQNKIIDRLESLIKGLNNDFHNNNGDITTTFTAFGEAYSGLSGKNADSFGSGKPYITYLNVYQNNYINKNQYDYVTISDGEKQSKVSSGDILFTLSSETPNEVGIGSVYLGNDKELYLNSFCFGVHIKNNNVIYPPYMAHLVSSQYFRKAIYPLAQGSTRFNLQKNDFMKKTFILPSLEKQKQISKVLNSLSEKDNIEKQQLALLQAERLYLLRQMFI